MPIFQYGQTTMEWVFREDSKLKSHYITVERGRTIELKGPAVDENEQIQLIRQRARWIKQRIEEVNRPVKEVITTGSRLLYRGRYYYCEVKTNDVTEIKVTFKNNRFFISAPRHFEKNNNEPAELPKEELIPAMEVFFKVKTKDKLFPRVKYWQKKMELKATKSGIYSFKSRWANCNENNEIDFHPRCMEFSPAVADYIIVHELCHIVHKNHDKAFWDLVGRHYPDWRDCHAIVGESGREF